MKAKASSADTAASSLSYRYRTAVLLGKWRDTPKEAARDAVRSGQAEDCEAGAYGVRWRVYGRIEEESRSTPAGRGSEARAGIDPANSRAQLLDIVRFLGSLVAEGVLEVERRLADDPRLINDLVLAFLLGIVVARRSSAGEWHQHFPQGS